MTTTQNPLVIGIFQEEARAKQALTDLNAAGFAKDQLGFANTGGEAANTNLGSELMKFGVPQEHAGYYHNAFQAGQHVVSVRADGREQDAARILSNYGATGLNSDPNAGTAMPNSASQMASYNTYAADPSQNAASPQQQQYNDPNFNNAGLNQQQPSNDPNYNQNYSGMGNANVDRSYNNADQQQFNNAGMNQQQQQYNDPNYNNQQFNNAGYSNNDQRFNNDPNQGFNQAQNYDPNAFQGNNPNMGQERHLEREERREERRMEREEHDNNNF